MIERGDDVQCILAAPRLGLGDSDVFETTGHLPVAREPVAKHRESSADHVAAELKPLVGARDDDGVLADSPDAFGQPPDVWPALGTRLPAIQNVPSDQIGAVLAFGFVLANSR